MSEEKLVTDTPFGYGLSFYKYIWCFIIGSLFGTIYEEIIAFIKFGVHETRRGLIWGPFNPLYGVALVLSIMLFHRFKNPIKMFVIGGLFGAVFEYLLGVGQEIFIGTRSWSYEGQFMNIHGRTSVIYGLIWGFFIVLFVRVLYPLISSMVEKIPHKPGKIITNVLIVFFVLNMFVTFSMLIRFNLRNKGYEPITPLGEYYDEVFDNEEVYRLFPDMVPID